MLRRIMRKMIRKMEIVCRNVRMMKRRIASKMIILRKIVGRMLMLRKIVRRMIRKIASKMIVVQVRLFGFALGHLAA